MLYFDNSLYGHNYLCLCKTILLEYLAHSLPESVDTNGNVYINTPLTLNILPIIFRNKVYQDSVNVFLVCAISCSEVGIQFYECGPHYIETSVLDWQSGY